jgi:crossover junction endodeoxyribonuclease RuvC
LQTTGYAVIEAGSDGPRICEAGVLRSATGRETAEIGARCKVLYDGLIEVLEQWKPHALAMEQLFAHYDHPRTAILMAHARGCYMLAAAQHEIPAISYAPTRVKKTVTGSGRASKEQMQAAIMREFRLPKPPEPHDVADALAIALCHYYRVGGGLMGGARSATFQGVNLQALMGDADDSDDDLLDEDEAA